MLESAFILLRLWILFLWKMWWGNDVFLSVKYNTSVILDNQLLFWFLPMVLSELLLACFGAF